VLLKAVREFLEDVQGRKPHFASSFEGHQGLKKQKGNKNQAEQHPPAGCGRPPGNGLRQVDVPNLELCRRIH